MRKRKPNPQLPGSPYTREAAKERREGKKGPATAGLLTPVPNVNKRRTKMEAERSGLNAVIEEIVREGGCNKRKAELIETDLNKTLF